MILVDLIIILYSYIIALVFLFLVMRGLTSRMICIRYHRNYILGIFFYTVTIHNVLSGVLVCDARPVGSSYAHTIDVNTIQGPGDTRHYAKILNTDQFI